MTLVHWLHESPCGVDVVGGKAASVARLARMGLPTPDGFIVAAGAFAAYLEAGGAAERARALAAALPDDEAEAQLAALTEEHPLPEPLAGELAAGVERLAAGDGSRRLAVRSSARGEDSLSHSFAGQHDTLLGVEPDGVEAALRRCWASLWSARAAAYRAAQGMPPAAPEEMAVLVQPLVDAVASAVVFTVNPISGDREEVVVDAARGLGEGIVSGSVTADSIVLDRVTLAPVRIGSGRAEAADSNGHVPLSVSIAEAAELAELSLHAERGFRVPLDVEAARDRSGWWLLQARPITTAAPERPPLPPAEPSAALAAGGPATTNGARR